jgi:hypothetical protein
VKTRIPQNSNGPESVTNRTVRASPRIRKYNPKIPTAALNGNHRRNPLQILLTTSCWLYQYATTIPKENSNKCGANKKRYILSEYLIVIKPETKLAIKRIADF